MDGLLKHSNWHRETFYELRIDDLVKSQKVPFPVIPAKAGIHGIQLVLDPGFRRGDEQRDF